MRPPQRALFAAVVAGALTAAACTSATPPTTTPPATTTTDAPVAPSPPPVDRLVVLDEGGNVVTMRPDGSDVAALTGDAADGVLYFQPSWAPNGGSIVVSQTSFEGSSLVEFDLEAGSRSEVATAANAFYVHWSPRSDRLAYLSTDAQGLGLAIAEFGDEPTSTLVRRGQPFYFSWSPDGEQLATLVGETDLSLWESVPAGPAREIARPGEFLNPVWTAAGLFYITPAAGRDQLVLGGPGAEPRILAGSPAGAIFTAPASGARVAVQSSGELDGVQASLQAAPLLPLNRLVVIDTATGEMETVGNAPAIAFFWDPAGEQLLVLDAAARSLRWSVWKDGVTTPLTEFVPPRSFLQSYLPFFGQYALSTTFWAPDGGAFAFAGAVDGIQGIWVQDVGGGPPLKVADGSWVMWSPV